MPDIDAFASSLLEEAKRFLERAEDAKDTTAEQPFLHSALLLACCSLEAHVNSVADEMALRSDLSANVLGVLREKEVHLVDGVFAVGKKLKIWRLEDRVVMLHQISPKPNVNGEWRSKLSGALALRNSLSHPRTVPSITRGAVQKAIEGIIDTIDALYQSVYKKRFPAVHRQLLSKLDF